MNEIFYDQLLSLGIEDDHISRLSLKDNFKLTMDYFGIPYGKYDSHMPALLQKRPQYVRINPFHFIQQRIAPLKIAPIQNLTTTYG